VLSVALKSRFRESLLPRRAPSMLQWAVENIVIPDGPLRGQPFDPDTQPFSRLFLHEVDSGRWDRIAVTAVTQSGKTLIAYVVPVCFHLFALGESVVAGVPTADMSDDKWREDFLPVIEASPRLRALLPGLGAGSRSGRVRTRVKFRNGATLRFMSGGGSDKTRAGFTSRVLAVTEVDGLDQSGATSREADKLKQLEARQRAYLSTGIRTYLECTVSETKGRIWQEYLGGTESRIARPCPHCGKFVTPEREHLVGWQEAENELQARSGAAWTCPECKASWGEHERYVANLRSVLVHRGQEVGPDGQVIGPAPPTRTLGFRWTAVDNHFATAADIAADEWNARREHDRENAEKKMRQFVHCIPYDPPEVELTPLQPEEVAKRVADLKKGIAPNDHVGVTVGVDTGKRALHWTAMAWLEDGRGFVIDYGIQSVPSDRFGTRAGLLVALRGLKKYFDGGWQDQSGLRVTPRQVWIDSGWHEHKDPVYEFCIDANSGARIGTDTYRPSKGHGDGQQRMERYYAPKHKNREVRYIGREFYLSLVTGRVMLVHVNADHWKSELHQRLALPLEAPGAIVLYAAADRMAHADFVDQLTAERQVEKWIDGRGETVVWERMRRKNHHLDSTYQAVAAGHLVVGLQQPLGGGTIPPGLRPTAAQLAARPSLQEIANRR
jgi:phage terminase large subunit GpA-like protein